MINSKWDDKLISLNLDVETRGTETELKDFTVVYDHVIGRIFNGDFDAASYFLSGTLKWFYIENSRRRFFI